METILAVIDTVSGRIPASATELISFAREISSDTPGEIVTILAGEDPGKGSRVLSGYGCRVIALSHESLRYPNPELLARECSRLSREFSPRYICLPHTMRGCQAAARIAAATGLFCVTAVESFRREKEGDIFLRSMYNGKIHAELAINNAPAVLTVLPGSYPPPETGGIIAKGNVETRLVGEASPVTPLSIDETDQDTERLEEADVIVAAGRGIGTRENLELVTAVARLFPNSAVGASRTVCDLKWLPHSRQVGVTGKTVSPRLYLALGISGSQQHVAGMKGSQLIVAVNKDPQAAIFDVSDYIIIEDLGRFLPALLDQHQKEFS